MRVTVGLFVVLCTGALSQVLAAEPPPPSPSQTAPAPAPAEQPGATVPDVGHSATAPVGERNVVAPVPGSTPAQPAVTAKASSTDMTHEEKELISRGYKLEIRRGDRYFCRREPEIGSHFEIKSCSTADSILAKQATSEEAVRRMQAIKPEISN